jgi:4-oxalocrotonate tautomerase
MPYVNIRITTGATQEQKNQLYRGVTQLLVDILNKKPEETHIIIDEIELGNWGYKGENSIGYAESEKQDKSKE